MRENNNNNNNEQEAEFLFSQDLNSDCGEIEKRKQSGKTEKSAKKKKKTIFKSTVKKKESKLRNTNTPTHGLQKST